MLRAKLHGSPAFDERDRVSFDQPSHEAFRIFNIIMRDAEFGSGLLKGEVLRHSSALASLARVGIVAGSAPSKMNSTLFVTSRKRSQLIVSMTVR